MLCRLPIYMGLMIRKKVLWGWMRRSRLMKRRSVVKRVAHGDSFTWHFHLQYTHLWARRYESSAWIHVSGFVITAFLKKILFCCYILSVHVLLICCSYLNFIFVKHRWLVKNHRGKTFWEGFGISWKTELWVSRAVHGRTTLPNWSLSWKGACSKLSEFCKHLVSFMFTVEHQLLRMNLYF